MIGGGESSWEASRFRSVANPLEGHNQVGMKTLWREGRLAASTRFTSGIVEGDSQMPTDVLNNSAGQVLPAF
jgi:hypothetical protein